MGTSLTGLTPATTYDALIKVGDNGPITASLKTLSDGLGNDLPMEASTSTINFTGTLQQSGTAVPTAAQVNAKQDTLVSGTNIKTVNSTSLLGSGNVAVQDVLVSGTNIKTINSTSLLGSGNITIAANPSGVAGAIQFSNGSAFASDAANLFWDDTNKRLGIGTNAPTQLLSVGGVGKSGFINIARSSDGASVGYISGQSTGLRVGNGTYAFFGNTGSLNGINVADSPLAMWHVKGSGSTSATTSLLVQNSGGTTSINATDDGSVTVGSNSYIALRRTDSILIRSFAGYEVHIGNGATNYLSVTSGGTHIATGSSAPVASAVLQADSTTKGFLPPRMTTTQKNAISTPSAGLVVYDSTTNKLCCYNGSTWNDLF